MLMPVIRNVEPISAVEKMLSAENMRESNRQLWAEINQYLREINYKISIEHRDGSIQVLDDAARILRESFKN